MLLISILFGVYLTVKALISLLESLRILSAFYRLLIQNMGKPINKNIQNYLLFFIVSYLETSKLETSISGLMLKPGVQFIWNQACSFRPQERIDSTTVEKMSGWVESGHWRESKKKGMNKVLASGCQRHRQTNQQTSGTFRRMLTPSRGLDCVPTRAGLSIEKPCVKDVSFSQHGKEDTVRERYCLFAYYKICNWVHNRISIRLTSSVHIEIEVKTM